MVPGQHHVRMNMYIAQAKNGRFEVLENLGSLIRKSACKAQSNEEEILSNSLH